MENEDDDPAVLSSSTLAILKDFLVEREKADEECSKDPFAENWGMSQAFCSFVKLELM